MECNGVHPTTQFVYWKGVGTRDALLCITGTGIEIRLCITGTGIEISVPYTEKCIGKWVAG